jgi:DNA repair protein RadC
MKIAEISPSYRPRERLRKFGVGTLSDAELLALVISSGTTKVNALDLAHKCLSVESPNLGKLLARRDWFCKGLFGDGCL